MSDFFVILFVFDDAIVVLVINNDTVGLQFVGLFCCSQEVVFLNAWALTADEGEAEWTVGTQSRDFEGALHLFLIHIHLNVVENFCLAFVSLEQLASKCRGVGTFFVIGLHLLHTEIAGA